eukprot:scaffold24618_cov127-Cylindrotheca_fusiformis.AAC.7
MGVSDFPSSCHRVDQDPASKRPSSMNIPNPLPAVVTSRQKHTAISLSVALIACLSKSKEFFILVQ